MGQSSSQPERRVDRRQDRRRSILRQSNRRSVVDDGRDTLLSRGQSVQGASQIPLPPASTAESSQLRTSPRWYEGGHVEEPPHAEASRPREPLLQRTRSTIRDMFGGREGAHAGEASSPSRLSQSFLQRRHPSIRTATSRHARDYVPPRLPSIDLSHAFGEDTFSTASDAEELQLAANAPRRSNIRWNALRPDRPFRHVTSSLRRRRSPRPTSFGETAGTVDQATLLSRILSAAAATTAATLMGNDHQALREARSLTGTGLGELSGSGDGEDGSFDGFLRALQNGRIASALRQGSDDEGNAAVRERPLNFFRMFRFGASTADPTPSSTGLGDPSEADDSTGDARMVPIIIVGIRSINPGAAGAGSAAAENLPPFINALGDFSSNVPTTTWEDTEAYDSIDSFLRPPQNGTSFRHRRRASMGGFGLGRSRLSDRLDDQRDHRSPDRRRDRPWSIASSTSAMEPRPPPATPASPSPELSRISSRNTTPNHSRPASFVANSVREFPDSRRNSMLHRSSAASPLSAHTEETASLHSIHSGTNLLPSSADIISPDFHAHRRSETSPHVHYPRFASGHPRRNGVVEPDHLPSLSRASATDSADSGANDGDAQHNHGDSRSWIIYVLGGSYPENHPILTTPSLFSENPTYEDMMLLSALLGPAKAPVATEEDVESAGGVYEVVRVDSAAAEADQQEDRAKTAHLVATAVESDDRVEIEAGQRCLVCLCDFEEAEVCRKLVKCSHLFHKECIDQWLTQGRNSCPLCRGQGVDEKERASAPTTPDGTVEHPVELEAGA